MRKILHVAWREFVATAATKGFIIGAIVVPALIAAVIPVVVLLAMKAKGPEVVGEVAIVDATGELGTEIQGRLSGESLRARREGEIKRATELVQGAAPMPGGGAIPPEGMGAGQELAVGQVPRITVTMLEQGADVEKEKEPIRAAGLKSKDDPTGRLALAVIDAGATKPDEEGKYGAYQLYVRPKLDERVIGDLRWALSEAIRDGRYRQAGVERGKIEALTRVEAQGTMEVTASGTRRSTVGVTMLLPLAFMLLMMISVMVGGQYLLTTTMEEKSSRVVEVLLSAVSPMELMTGKILGQMGVGATLLLVYSGVGIGALLAFSVLDLVGPEKFVYLLAFSLIAYMMVASMLAAVGSAVNELREAQSLQTPVVMMVVIPYLLWLPISRDPNSVLATTLSFIPPISPFVMVMRITSTEPPPTWQVLLSLAVGALGAYGCLWAAAKVFRVGLLMHGKAPSYATLWKWIRMA